ncbi:MBL fold metallo-hydrolase [Oceaniglobus ichthyenteri]|uniref:MBL fold metallo-hydrolase n=1 Tax=Oceaniglobus ichthyenteri TaxID=2136177 RepID=UPI000D3A2951|nr:MBL fold metallo-hydrolase [Oceaniglobus ichthyenteri]
MFDHTSFNPAPGVIEQILPGVRRILARNPSPMTFRGTNTYVVGQGQVAVIDPGPKDAAHLAALLSALAGETITHILVTHAHVDHSALAQDLSERTGAPIYAFGTAEAGRSPVMTELARQGLARGGEGVDTAFAPDHHLVDGMDIIGKDWRLTAHHTPGHMANHMCFALGDTVFSGDQVMGWSTSMVSPPDGDLSAFMHSCEKMRRWNARLLLPGHGAPVTDPTRRLTDLIAHRNARTAQIKAALGATPASIAAITRAIYPELQPNMHPIAARNVFAHLIDLVSKNQAKAVPHLSETADFKRL